MKLFRFPPAARAARSCCRSHSRWALTALGLTLASAAFAGDAPPPNAPAAPEAPPEEKKSSSVEEVTYTVIPGDRRDPFTFLKVVPKVSQQVDPSNGNPGGGTNPEDAHRLDAAQIAQKRGDALNFYNSAEMALMDMNAAESMARCDHGLEVFKDVQMNFYPALQEVRDLLLRLRKAADRVRQRQDAERDFNMMNIHLTGVVARERNSEAIVNTKIVGKGDVVPTSQEGVDVVVADIQPQQVVFIFRGYKMILTLSEIGR